MSILLPLKYIYLAERGDPNLLESVDTFSSQDQEYYDQNGWHLYRDEYHERVMLPSLGDARYFGDNSPVIPLAGKRYRLNVTSDDRNESFEPKGKYLVLEETLDPETKSDKPPKPGYRGNHYYQVFGQPHWIQGEYYPVGPNGQFCSHLVTVENGWGDSGNWNILVSLNDQGLPEIAYFEASCC